MKTKYWRTAIELSKNMQHTYNKKITLYLDKHKVDENIKLKINSFNITINNDGNQSKKWRYI